MLFTNERNAQSGWGCHLVVLILLCEEILLEEQTSLSPTTCSTQIHAFDVSVLDDRGRHRARRIRGYQIREHLTGDSYLGLELEAQQA